MVVKSLKDMCVEAVVDMMDHARCRITDDPKYIIFNRPLKGKNALLSACVMIPSDLGETIISKKDKPRCSECKDRTAKHRCVEIGVSGNYITGVARGPAGRGVDSSFTGLGVNVLSESVAAGLPQNGMRSRGGATPPVCVMWFCEACFNPRGESDWLKDEVNAFIEKTLKARSALNGVVRKMVSRM